MMARGVGDGAGRSSALLHHDRINGVLRARRGARMTAIRNGGTIPEMGDYRVVADPDETAVGTVNEDFAIESMIGDIFLLGSTSWRIRRVESGIVRVVDAAGAPPTIPFWLGEAPGRTIELSEEVSRLRRDIVEGLHEHDALVARLQEECGLMDLGVIQMVEYIRAAATGWASSPRRRTSSSSASSTRRVACRWWCTPPTGRGSTAPGGWRCASDSALPSISRSRPLPAMTLSCSLWARSTAFPWRTPGALCGRATWRRRWSRRCWPPPSFPPAGAGTPRGRSPSPPARRPQGAALPPADALR